MGLGDNDFPGPTAMGINNDGVIAGLYGASPGRGFTWKDGAYTAIDVPGATVTRVLGINNADQLVGWTDDALNSGGSRGFVKSGEDFVFHALPGERDTYASGINDMGMVVGWTGKGQSWVWDGEDFTLFDVPEALHTGSTEARSINNAGQIVGNVNTGSGEHGFLAQLIQIEDRPTPGDTNNDGRVSLDDLNNVRNHFGNMGPADGTLLGDTFPFDGFINIDDLNAVLNNFDATSPAAPVPEPAGLGLIVLASIAGLATSRRETK